MLAIQTVFWMLVIVFSVIGAMRGWAKEVVAAAGIVLGLFAIETFDAPLRRFLAAQPDMTRQFLLQLAIFVAFVFFAYQGPRLVRLVARSGEITRSNETIRDSLLGLVMGALNGYLIAGTIWYYLDRFNYPFPADFMLPPAVDSPAYALLGYMPPVWLKPFLPPVLIVLFVVVIVMMV